MLTPKQKKVLDFVKSYSKKHAYPPSLSEIGKHLKVSSPATVHQHLEAIASKGFLEPEKPQKRSIVISEAEPTDSPYSGPVGLDSFITMERFWCFSRSKNPLLASA